MYDQETGFYYLQSWYYDPAIGRFINADNVISYAGNSLLGCNVFAYCFNNPVNLSDDSAHWPKLSPKTVLSAFSTLVKVAVTVAVSIKSAISTSRKTAIFVTHPLLKGFIDRTWDKPFEACFEPIHMTHVQAARILKKASVDTDLFRIYNIWAEKV